MRGAYDCWQDQPGTRTNERTNVHVLSHLSTARMQLLRWDRAVPTTPRLTATRLASQEAAHASSPTTTDLSQNDPTFTRSHCFSQQPCVVSDTHHSKSLRRDALFPRSAPYPKPPSHDAGFRRWIRRILVAWNASRHRYQRLPAQNRQYSVARPHRPHSQTHPIMS